MTSPDARFQATPSRSRTVAFAALAVVWTAAGCTPRGEGHDLAEPQLSAARLSLVFSRTAFSDVVRFDAEGHFARFAVSDGDHLPAILGLQDDDVTPVDGCRVVDPAAALDRALAAARAAPPVKLLDAGRLLVKGPFDAAALAPHHYPELTPYVSGIVYGNEDGQRFALDPGGDYEVTAEGGEDIGPFHAQASAPRAFPSLDVPIYHRGTDLEVRWHQAAEPSAPLVLSVAWSARGASREVRCRVRDDGWFTIGRELLAALPGPGQLVSAEVSAVRTHSVPVTAPGVARGELRIALREALSLVVAASGPSGNGLAVTGEER